MTGLSIVICCFNSSWIIESTLNAIIELENLETIDWEVIIVNNASTDTTELVVANWIIHHNQQNRFKLVLESLPGLTNARLAGIKFSSFDTILFVDDDNLLDSNYASLGFEILKSNPQIGILGGWGTAHAEIGHEIPDWFWEVQEAYSCGNMYAFKEGMVEENSFVRGAGMFARKSLLEKIYHRENPLLLTDRSPGKLTSGGDIEMCFRAKMLDAEVWFSKHLHFKHVMNATKLNLDYKQKLFDSLAEQTVVLKYYWRHFEVKKMSWFTRLFQLLNNLSKWLYGKLLNDCHRKDWAESYLYELTKLSLFQNIINQRITQFAKSKTVSSK